MRFVHLGPRERDSHFWGWCHKTHSKVEIHVNLKRQGFYKQLSQLVSNNLASETHENDWLSTSNKFLNCFGISA